MAKAVLDENTGNVGVTCEKCGKPIVKSNQWGMFCEDNCGLEKSKEAKKMVDGLLKMFAGPH